MMTLPMRVADDHTADCRFNGVKDPVTSSCGACGIVRSGRRWYLRRPRAVALDLFSPSTAWI